LKEQKPTLSSFLFFRSNNQLCGIDFDFLYSPLIVHIEMSKDGVRKMREADNGI
jgi:hypothetical protein